MYISQGKWRRTSKGKGRGMHLSEKKEGKGIKEKGREGKGYFRQPLCGVCMKFHICYVV